MVGIEFSHNSACSPSSFSCTPQLTINHEAAIDQDSSNAFEGPEKLLEVWFAVSSVALQQSSTPEGLKVVPGSVWEDMLELVHCRVLSVVKSEQVDAYLLSESSMFVFAHKIILKTCGTTTLLRGLPKILEIAATVAGFSHTLSNSTIGVAAYPYRVFYSRKNFLFPHRQHGPHRSWKNEVKTLDGLFQRGSAYVIGKLNGEHWYLYLTEPNTKLTLPTMPYPSGTETRVLEPPSYKAHVASTQTGSNGEDDETLEILMTDLEEENAQQFYENYVEDIAGANHASRKGSINDDVFSNVYNDCKNGESDHGHELGTVVSQTCGLADIYPTSRYPEARIDAYLFSPCGFSANGVIPAAGGSQASHYFTVHVTPEPNCSYASFETNVPCRQTGRETHDIIRQVVHIFKPGRFSVTFFEAKCEADDPSNSKDFREEIIQGYRRIDRIVHNFDEYDLVFKYFERLDYTGRAGPRIGEIE